MKRSKVIVLILVLASLSGCLVSSLHPFFKAEDKYFDTTLVGYWMDGDSSIWTILPNMVSQEFMSPEKHDSSYMITYFEDDNKRAFLQATLFQINGVDYVDFLPDPDKDHCSSDMTSYHHVPVHTLARIQYCEDSIMLYWYGDDWLNDMLEENRIRIKNERVDVDYERHVLTASTDELQKFIKKYANDPKTVADIEAIFAKGHANDQYDYGVFLKLKPYHGKLPDKMKETTQPG